MKCGSYCLQGPSVYGVLLCAGSGAMGLLLCVGSLCVWGPSEMGVLVFGSPFLIQL